MKEKILRLESLLLSAFMAIPSEVWALGGRPNSNPNVPPPPAWVNIVPILVMVVIFYLLLFRPQSKQRKDRQALLNSVKKGDKIVTQGGLIATVVNVTPTVLDIKLNEETKVKLQRSAVAEVIREPELQVITTNA